MNRLAAIIVLLIGTNAFGQPQARAAKSPDEFVPASYVVFEKIRGDLNGDRHPDYVFIIKGTDKGRFVKDEYRGELDRNRRGIIVALSSHDGYELALENRDCFSSENEDGGAYFPPELDVFIRKGILHVHYGHGKYGDWTYSFRYENPDFRLIGYERNDDRGPVVERSTSINLLTKKMRIQENVNLNAGEAGDERFRESWKTFLLSKPIKLREIADFDEFDVQGLLGLRE